MRYSKPELAAILAKELRQALGAPGSEISNIRVRNLQYYKAEPTGELAAPEIPDRSSIVSSDVADTVEWMLPSLLRPFVTSKDSLEAVAKRPQYKDKAKIAGEYLKHIFWKRNKGFYILHQWFKDALIQKVGFTKIFWEEFEEDVEESYTGLLPEQVAELLTDDVKPIEQSSYVVDIEGQQVELYDIKVKRTEQKGRCRVMGCPPEEMRVHPRARYGEEFPFIAQQFYRQRNELEAEGYDLSTVSTEDGWDQEEIERADAQTPFFFDDSDGELERFRCSECYIKLDQDKDGIPEWRRVFMIGETIMEDEKVDDHPFVYFCPNPLPHIFFGDCPADYAIGPQRLNTSLLRATLDNVYLSVNKRMGAVEGQVNMDDLLNARPGGIVRLKNNGALVPIEQGGLDQSAFQMIEWGAQWREQRTGYTRYSQGLSPDALNPTATGVNIITEKADQRTELTAHVAAETAVSVMFEKMLKCICKYQQKADQVELFDEWLDIDPREWVDAFHIQINVGLGTGSKDKKAMVLQQVLQIQQPMAMAGALPPQAVILAARDFAEAAGLTMPEQYFPDIPPPDPNAPRPPSPEEIKAQGDMQKMQMQAQVDQAKQEAQSRDAANQAQLQAQLEQQRMEHEGALEQWKTQQTMQLEQWKAQLQAELEREKASLGAETAVTVAQIKAGSEMARAGQEQTEKPKQDDDTLKQLLEAVTRPKTIIRDANGRVSGVQ